MQMIKSVIHTKKKGRIIHMTKKHPDYRKDQFIVKALLQTLEELDQQLEHQLNQNNYKNDCHYSERKTSP